jgi:hypothetical protein
MKKFVTVIVILLIVAVCILGYFNYENNIAPKIFVKSFLEELELDGVPNIEDKYFVRDYAIKPLESWDKYFKENSANKNSREKLFSIWKNAYMAKVQDYLYLSPNFQNPVMMSRKEFISAYNNIKFDSVSLASTEIDGNLLKAEGYAHVNSKKYIANQIISGKKEFKIIAMDGNQGWRIVFFALQI